MGKRCFLSSRSSHVRHRDQLLQHELMPRLLCDQREHVIDILDESGSGFE